MTTSTRARDPRKPSGRPTAASAAAPRRSAPTQLARLAGEYAALMGTSHRQKPVKALVGRVRAGLAELLGAPDGYEVALGNGGTTAFWDAAAFGARARARAAPRLRRVLAQVRRRHRARAVPRRPDRPAGRARRRARSRRAARRRRHRLGAQRDLDRRHGAGRPAPAGSDDALVLIDATSGAGGLPLDAAQADAYYFAPQKSFGSDGGLWLALLSPAAIERIDEIAATDRWIPEFLSPAARRWTTRARTRRSTRPRSRRSSLLADQLDWMLEQGGLDWCVARTTASSDALYGWAEASVVRDAVRRRPGQALARRRHDRLRRRGRRRAASPRRCAPTASSTSSPTASSGATSCASRCSRRSSPPTCRR